MKQFKIIAAYKTIEDIKQRNKEYPLAVAHAIFKIKKTLQDQWDFQVEEERKLFEKYSPVSDDGNSIKFASDEDAKAFSSKIAELSDMDVELDYIKPKIRLSEQFDLTLSEMEALDDFIEFIGEGE